MNHDLAEHTHHDHPDAHEHVEGRVHSTGRTHAVAPVEPSRAVMINVGANTGALVLHSSAERAGIEVHVYPTADPSRRTPVWVLPREGRDGVVYAAIFPSLAIGDWAVLNDDDSVAMVIAVPPNKVTQAEWH
jgi:hypothetical protein